MNKYPYTSYHHAIYLVLFAVVILPENPTPFGFVTAMLYFPVWSIIAGGAIFTFVLYVPWMLLGAFVGKDLWVTKMLGENAVFMIPVIGYCFFLLFVFD